MENLEQILQLWTKDAEIDQTEPGKELLNIPKLHNKYLTILTQHRMAGKKAHFDYLRMRKIKWEYYTGKMSQEELEQWGWEPFQFTLKSDITTYLESDKDLIKLLEKKIIHEEAVSVIESIMNELKQRTWQLRDYIGWEKFIGGQ
ncbi:Recombination, repair and ssDNA binding protein UvsY [uncultured Caudovirales phage]|uniref:Recombination, repair and ssDNA binding protein UvsY n=1 Tax=uncultured Caudovirales phage TaxID=2100421 RepID=A0A6J5LKD5_9CAUD|nr:Recombination, repair and ssDNA binding protein UvsY [uncultured Caudovirales phage]